MVDDEYRPVPAGVPGAKVLVTNLYNRVQPLIRYEVGDVVTLSPSRQENEPELARGSLRALADFPLRELLTLADPEPGEALRAAATNVRMSARMITTPLV